MKNFFKRISSQVDFWNLFIGLVIGFGVGAYALNAVAPTKDQMLKLCRLDPQSVEEDRQTKVSHGGHANPYMMGAVTSEKQFLEEMVEHHEAAVVMAQQVLALHPRAELKKLAETIISAQTAEIKQMKDWLSAWK